MAAPQGLHGLRWLAIETEWAPSRPSHRLCVLDLLVEESEHAFGHGLVERVVHDLPDEVVQALYTNIPEGSPSLLFGPLIVELG